MPHLHRIEMRYPGIAFQAHEMHGIHRAIASHFGNEESPWDADQISMLSLKFARGLDVAMRYAQQVDHEDYARDFIDKSMSQYSNYYHPQTEEWWDNPVFRLAGVGSATADPDDEFHGKWHA
eukprot:692026-Prymnesium_polylepis.1